MKKRYMMIVLLVVALASIILYVRFRNRRDGEEAAQYTNFFEYAVDMNEEGYTYTPKGLAYGMSKEEVLRQENLEDYEENEKGNISCTKTVSNVSEEIGEVQFTKSYIFAEDNSGLVRTQYSFVLKTEDSAEFLEMLYDHAKSYMPQPQQGTMPGIEAGEHVEWCECISESEGAQEKRSAVRFNAETDASAGRTVIVLTVEICS